MHSYVGEITEGLRRHLKERSAARALMNGDAGPARELYEFLAQQGLLAISLPEELGGVGLGLKEEAEVLESLSYFVSPVPVLPLYLAAYVLAARRAASPELRSLAEALASGRSRVGVAVSVKTGFDYAIASDVNCRISGTIPDVLDGATLDIFIVHSATGWWAVDVKDTKVSIVDTLDATRRLASISFSDAPGIWLGDIAAAKIEAVAWVGIAAEALGAAQACLDLAVEHALTRKQFGEPIGRFQATKQKLADNLMMVEAARSTLWGACNILPGELPNESAARAAKALATQAAVTVAGDAVQLHGAMGVTWEHDLHLLMRRSKHCQLALGVPESHLAATADILLRSVDTERSPDEVPELFSNLNEEDGSFLAELRAWLDVHATRERVSALKRSSVADRRAWQAEMADGGWVGIHWPQQYGGRDASFTQQILYHAELTARGLPRLVGNRGLTIVAPTLIKHGSHEQKKLLEPTRRGDILWSTAFSEPGAGSDLASLQTVARIEGDELVINGTKIWTTSAHFSDWAYTLVRTGPKFPKHDGITCVVLPLDVAGLQIVPIRLNNGSHHFNQLFFDDVRIPLTNIVGPVNEGWTKVNRTSMAHEHFTNFLGTHAGYSRVLDDIVKRLAEREAIDQAIDHDLRRRLANSAISVKMLHLNGMRNVVRIQAGEDPGAEGSIQKVLGQEEEKRLFELALDVAGAAGVANSRWGRAYLSSRAATIGGGTSEIHRNKLAERVLGMPRDPWSEEGKKVESSDVKQKVVLG